MIPGLSSQSKNVTFDENGFKPFEVMIASMTPYERCNPDIIDRNRKYRIAQGCGMSFEKVSSLIGNFKDMRKKLCV